jgi:ligand-binding sensor domain-containing protein
LAVFLAIGATCAAGSDAGYSVRQWDVKEGLPQSSVSDVVQTPDGFLWIGTLHSGLARFDGASFECYDLANTPQLGHAGIRRLLIDKPGRLWVNTYGPGLLVLENGGFKPVLSPVPPVDALLAADTDTALFVLPENHIYQVRRGSDGVWRGEKLPNFTENPVTNWVGAADGIAWYRRQDGRIGRFEKDRRIDLPGIPGFDETRTSSLQSDRDGRIWITSGNRFGVWNGRIFEDASPLGEEQLTDLVRVAPAGAGSVWVETTHRLRLCRDRQWIAESKDWDPKLYGPPIGRARRTDDEAGLWIQVTDLGLVHVRADGKLSKITAADGLGSSALSCLLPDGHGGLWTGYGRGGLVNVRPSQFRTIKRPDGLDDTLVTSVCEDAGGAVWIGSAGGSLSRWKDGTITRFPLPLSGNRSQTPLVAAGPDGRVWVATDGNGLLVRDGDVFRHVITPEKFASAPRALLADRAGRVWIAAFSGIFRVEGERMDLIQPISGAGSYPGAIAEAADGSVWIGTLGGELLQFTDREIKRIALPDSGPRNFISALQADEDDYIVSKGGWDQAYSLGLSNGHLRFAIGGFSLQCDEQIPLNQWVHVAATYDGLQMAVLVDGKLVKSTESNTDAGPEFLYHPDAPDPDGRKVGIATRVIGGDGGRDFMLAPGETSIVVSAILGDLDVAGKDPLLSARDLVAGLDKEKITAQANAHRLWWRNFWNRSFIEIPDKTIEQFWYSSWYIMASCSRAGKVAPGLWGNWLTVDNPAWHGDFHLNYNFQAPFYGLYAANHADLTQPFYDAMNQSIPRGRRIAAKRGWKGIHLPVSIGPWGMCPEGDDSDWGQRSNTAYCAILFIWHWQHTRDKEWLRNTGYTFLRETALFWEDYLKLEKGPDGNARYVICNDSVHEGSGPDFNSIVSLAFVRALFTNMIPISETLGEDESKRAKWRDIVDRLSDYPTQDRGGKTVFRYTEKGMAWNGGNTVGIQHIFPGGAIGLDSDPKLLEISRNMIDAMGRWRDFNGSSSWYAACARIGYNPERILTELRGMYDRHSLPNKLLNFGGGGIENVSPAHAVTEMLLQSHEGVIRLFPCWPADQDANFGTLRAVGAFLISAELKGGHISGVKISSEKGADCIVMTPWPGGNVRIIRNGKQAETITVPTSTTTANKSNRFTLRTSIGEVIELMPEPPR